MIATMSTFIRLTLLSPDYANDIIHVLVGEEGKEFAIHRATLCRHSTCFKSACSKEWKEGEESHVRLPEADPKVFAVYAHWAYTGTLDASLMNMNLIDCLEFDLPLGKTWILSNFLGDDKFCNVIVDDLLLQFDQKEFYVVSASTATYICDNTAEESKLKVAICDMVAARMTTVQFTANREKYPHEVFVEMASRYAASQVPQAHTKMYPRRGDYHLTEQDEQEKKPSYLGVEPCQSVTRLELLCNGGD